MDTARCSSFRLSVCSRSTSSDLNARAASAAGRTESVERHRKAKASALSIATAATLVQLMTGPRVGVSTSVLKTLACVSKTNNASSSS